MGTLTTAIGMLILVPLTEEEEAQQLHETLERSTIEKKASNVLYLEGVGPSAFELQRREL